MTDLEFYKAIYQMRNAQKDVAQQKSNYTARAKARSYEHKVDKELEERLSNL